MIFDRVMPVKVPASIGVPNIQWMQHVASPAATMIRGTILIFNAGEVDTGGTNPTAIVGVALAASATAPGYNAQNNPLVFTGRQRKIPVARADRITVFGGYLTNNSSTKVNPTVADIGAEYGLTAYTNIWTIDKNKTGANARVEVVGIDELWNGIYFKFLEAHISSP